jgi:GDP-L-fucose synthase
MTKILITGASGMVGKHLVDMCLQKGYFVKGTDIRYDERYSEEKYWGENFDFQHGNLNNYQRCLELVDDVDVVFQVAGVKGSPKRAAEQPNDYFTPMLQMNTNMAEAARIAGVEWYVYTSTIGVYQPAEVFKEDDVWKTFPSENDKYAGWVKRLGELQLDCFETHYGLKNYSIVRPANIYGEYDNFGEESTVIASLVKKGCNDKLLSVWGDGTPIRDFIHAEDVARGILMSYENKITEPINLGSGDGVRIRDIASIVATHYGKEIEYDLTKPNGDKKRLMDMTRANSYGFHPQVDLETGIKRVIKYYESLQK